IFYQRASVQARDIDPLDSIARLRHLLHLHLSFRSYEEQLYSRIFFLQSRSDGNGREYMSTRTSARYDDLLAHAAAPSLLSFPSIASFSTLRATLRMMPMARQVNRNELPPMLTSGRV